MLANVGRLCDGLKIATGQLGTNAEQRNKIWSYKPLLNFIMSDETKVEQGENVDGNSVSQPIAKPNVIGSQIEVSPETTYDKYVQMLKNKSYNILYSLNGMSVEQAKRVLQMASENLDLSATVDLKPQEL